MRSHFFCGEEINMPSNPNAHNWDLLDSAAKTVRGRITPGSSLYALLNNTASPKTNEVNTALNVNSTPMDGEEISLPCTQQLFSSAEEVKPQIGDMPPQPPTLRGRVGAVLVRIVRRMLFWYTDQLRALHKIVSEAAGEQAHALQELDAERRRQRALLSNTVERLAVLERQLTDNQARGLKDRDTLVDRQNALTNEISSLGSQIALCEQHIRKLRHDQETFACDIEGIAHFREEERLHRESMLNRVTQIDQVLASHASAEAEQRQRTESLAGRLNQLNQALAALEDGQRRRTDSLADRLNQIDQALAAAQQTHASFEQRIVQDLSAGIKDVRQTLHETKTHLLQQELRLKMLLRETRKHSLTKNGAPELAPPEELRHMFDPLFVEHARSFRGSRPDIKNRLGVYVPYAKEAIAATAAAPGLDLGCGRGEWLEILHTLGLAATGVDWNRDLVGENCERGLDAFEGDILEMLRSLPDESRSIITAFHVLEHVSFQDLLEIIDHTVRILKPGGIAIFETPNPRNLFVSTNNFYLDPTHRHPLPSEFLAFVVEARGLCEPNVIPLSPFPEYSHLPGSDCPAVKFINDHFYGPQDYGIVAVKA
jgi:O-antigen chain-terminating methyltransferase